LLRKGFALVFAADGRSIRSAAELGEGDIVRTRLHDGDVLSRVQSKEENPWQPKN